MASSDRIEFLAPVLVGDMVELAARVVRVGRISMTVAVEGTREVLMTGERQLAMRGTFEMVAVDGAGRPVPLACVSSSSIASEEGLPS